jgi:class 3 adenylate cyclase/pimeloyl-ACP methyl ester carboxylesterase
MKVPEIRFCTSADGTRIAYAIEGTGPRLVMLPGWGSTIEHDWRCDLGGRALIDGLAKRCTLLYIDMRGTGASERDPGEISLQAFADDVAAAVRHAGWDHFGLFGNGDGTVVALAYAAANADRVERLILWAPFAKTSRVMRPEFSQTMQTLIRESWGTARRAMSQAVFPSGPTTLVLHTAEAFKDAMSSETFVRYLDFRKAIDIEAMLPEIAQPTLVLHRRGDRNTPLTEGRAVAAAMPNARLVALEGDHGVPTDVESFLPLIWDFIGLESASERAPEVPQGTAVILFADVVDSTPLTERLGDAAFREKARALDTSLRRIIRDASGTPIEGKLLGDGVLATFTSARQAIEAAVRCGAAGDDAGLRLHLGLHAGDVIREDDDVFGGAVNIAARIAGESAAGEVLVSQTVRELARTSAGVSFEDRGERALKGVSEQVRVWAVRARD